MNFPFPSSLASGDQSKETFHHARIAPRRERGSVLIIVLWVAFGLVTLTLYFANSMSYEMRAADNRAAGIAAEQAIEGAARYVSNLLANAQERGVLPDLTAYRSEAVPVGDAMFWLLGRGDVETQTTPDQPVFGLVDEASRLHLNTVRQAMIETLPNMTAELAGAIVDWRDADDEPTESGAESQSYLRLNPPYRCKNAPFESVEELRLVFGAPLSLLYGDDANLNGALDANENDADLAPPSDNRDGRLDPGLFDRFTVYTRQPATGTNINNRQALTNLFVQKFGASRASQLNVATNAGSVLEFYARSGLTREEFIQIEADLVGTNTIGLVNVNTASEAVLACIPGVGTEQAPALVAYRRTNPGQLNTVAWVTEVLDRDGIRAAGPYLTGRTYQVTADVAAVGPHGRGYRRVKFVFDTSSGSPQVIYRQDLTHLGWSLGRQVRQQFWLAKELR